MSNNIHYRPWGNLEWLLTKVSITKYSIITCLSTEERCTKTLSICESKSCIDKIKIFEIIDPIDTDIHKSLRKKNLASINPRYQKDIIEINLLSQIDILIQEVKNFIELTNGNVILDISCFPKRFFFPIIKILLRDNQITSLIITCSTPEEYAKENLSEDPQPWSHLPLFIPNDPEEKFSSAIVGVGFMPLALPQLLKDKYSELPTKFLFPFPPGSPTYQRTWEFVNKINENVNFDVRNLYRVDAYSVTDAFDKICSIVETYNRNLLFAPYGPKTISLAMCLYACLTNSAVYYTQPMAYNPNYSLGVKDCLGYIVKMNSLLLYNIS